MIAGLWNESSGGNTFPAHRIFLLHIASEALFYLGERSNRRPTFRVGIGPFHGVHRAVEACGRLQYCPSLELDAL
jgi:hypothetical protein